MHTSTARLVVAGVRQTITLKGSTVLSTQSNTATPAVNANHILECAASIHNDLVQIRRHLHQHPERSERETETTNYLMGIAQQWGTTIAAPDGIGAWVDIGSSSAARIAIRADIDALPIRTALTTDYRSQSEGLMHACGHDAHAAMAVGAAMILGTLAKQNLGDDFATRVVFQPAEETSTGALHMIRAGAFRDIDAALALHVDPSRPVGTFGYRCGVLTAGCDIFHCEILGSSGHGARPHLSSDAFQAAMTWAQMLSERLPRCTDPRQPLIANVGSFHAGDAPNVVPGRVEIRGTIRALTESTFADALKSIQAMNAALESLFDVKVHFDIPSRTPPLDNDLVVSRHFQEATQELFGSDAVQPIEEPSMGAEDFAFVSATVPSSMMRIGVAGEEVGHHPLHSASFDIDESALSRGAAALAYSAIQLSRRGDRS